MWRKQQTLEFYLTLRMLAHILVCVGNHPGTRQRLFERRYLTMFCKTENINRNRIDERKEDKRFCGLVSMEGTLK